jgi:hypothetical protein
VFHLGIFAAADDEINVRYGIGGEEYSFRKVVDEIQFALFKIIKRIVNNMGSLL